MSYTLYQQVADRSPGSAAFSMQTQKATELYYCAPSELREALEDIIGSTRTAGDGKLERKLPKCHPQWTNLYVASVDVTGMGRESDTIGGQTAALVDAEKNLEAPPITTQFWQYALYQLRVEFLPRPYAVLSDTSITLTNTSYYNTSNTLINTTVASEWYRYCDFDYAPSPEFAYAQHGQQTFRLGNTAPPHMFTASGFPRMTIPKASLTIVWHEIPFSYLFSRNSSLVEYVGRINQNEWFGWNPGELMYLGCKVIRRYPPPFPDQIAGDGGTTFDTEKLVDLALSFEETVRTQSNVPTYGAGNTNTTIANRSYVIGGFNLQPFLGTANTNSTVRTKGFYYAGSAEQDKTPAFDSFEMAELFTDPDAL